MRKYIDNLLIYGSAIVGLATFFRIDAKTVSEWYSAMSGRIIVVLVCAIAFVIGVAFKWRERKVTPRNVQAKIRQWLDAFNIEHGVFNYEPWHFTLRVSFLGSRIFVGRPRTQSGRYIAIQLRTSGIQKEHQQTFDALSPTERRQLYGELALETARARISFTANPQLNDITIQKNLPITNQLTESDFIDGLTQIHQSGVIIWNTLALRLSDKANLKQLSPSSEITLPAPDQDKRDKSATV